MASKTTKLLFASQTPKDVIVSESTHDGTTAVDRILLPHGFKGDGTSVYLDAADDLLLHVNNGTESLYYVFDESEKHFQLAAVDMPQGYDPTSDKLRVLSNGDRVVVGAGRVFIAVAGDDVWKYYAIPQGVTVGGYSRVGTVCSFAIRTPGSVWYPDSDSRIRRWFLKTIARELEPDGGFALWSIDTSCGATSIDPIQLRFVDRRQLSLDSCEDVGMVDTASRPRMVVLNGWRSDLYGDVFSDAVLLESTPFWQIKVFRDRDGIVCVRRRPASNDVIVVSESGSYHSCNTLTRGWRSGSLFHNDDLEWLGLSSQHRMKVTQADFNGNDSVVVLESCVEKYGPKTFVVTIDLQTGIKHLVASEGVESMLTSAVWWKSVHDHASSAETSTRMAP